MRQTWTNKTRPWARSKDRCGGRAASFGEDAKPRGLASPRIAPSRRRWRWRWSRFEAEAW